MTTFCRVRLVICGVSCRAVSFCNSTIFFCLQSGLVSCAVTTSFHSDEKFWLVKVYGFWLVNRYYNFYIIIRPFSLLSTLWYFRRVFDIIVSICRLPIYVRHSQRCKVKKILPLVCYENLFGVLAGSKFCNSSGPLRIKDLLIYVYQLKFIYILFSNVVACIVWVYGKNF